MKMTIAMVLAMIATPAAAQTTWSNSNCYVAGNNVSCTGQSQTVPDQRQRERPAYQDMMAAQLQSQQDDWQRIAAIAARERLLKNCRKAAAAHDEVYLDLNCR